MAEHERLVQGESEMKEPTVEREQEIADGKPDPEEEQDGDS